MTPRTILGRLKRTEILFPDDVRTSLDHKRRQLSQDCGKDISRSQLVVLCVRKVLEQNYALLLEDVRRIP